MQKTIIILSFLFSALGVKAQETNELPIDQVTNKVSYAAVVEAPGISKKALFDNAKKWIKTKNSEVNPYTINYENLDEGAITGKGSFSLPGDRRKYTVQFAVKVSAKDNKFKYEFTDFIIQFRTQAGSSGGGYGGWGGSSYHDAETLEYTLETFYPSRLHGRKPSIKWYEEVNKRSFETINREIQSLASSLKQVLATKNDW